MKILFWLSTLEFLVSGNEVIVFSKNWSSLNGSLLSKRLLTSVKGNSILESGLPSGSFLKTLNSQIELLFSQYYPVTILQLSKSNNTTCVFIYRHVNNRDRNELLPEKKKDNRFLSGPH
ncbi:hypothetical protein EDC94DRAFT_608131 [Helicostylum pulchrum]|nr:hypothetical protein EDC94DRAFT_608131 [Helicostylum pulchrum]